MAFCVREGAKILMTFEIKQWRRKNVGKEGEGESGEEEKERVKYSLH